MSIAMDFIVKLPISEGYNPILTITDTFSKACIFIPSNETIDAAGTALLYATYVTSPLWTTLIHHIRPRPTLHGNHYPGTYAASSPYNITPVQLIPKQMASLNDQIRN
jgi:hypothetical protein